MEPTETPGVQHIGGGGLGDRGVSTARKTSDLPGTITNKMSVLRRK